MAKTHFWVLWDDCQIKYPFPPKICGDILFLLKAGDATATEKGTGAAEAESTNATDESAAGALAGDMTADSEDESEYLFKSNVGGVNLVIGQSDDSSDSNFEESDGDQPSPQF